MRSYQSLANNGMFSSEEQNCAQCVADVVSQQ